MQGAALQQAPPDASACTVPLQPDSLHPQQTIGLAHAEASPAGRHNTDCTAAADMLVQSASACCAPPHRLCMSGVDTCTDVVQDTAAHDSLLGTPLHASPTEAANSCSNTTVAGRTPSGDLLQSPGASPVSSKCHADCPPWLPEQISQMHLSYAAAGQLPGLLGTALLGQRVAFVLLEEFQQHDSRKEVDILLAGLHTGQ